MRYKFSGLILIIILSTICIPALAGPAGYAQAIYGTQWQLTDWGTWKGHYLDEGEGLRWWKHITIENIGTGPLTESVAQIWVWRIKIGGVFYYDPSIIDNKLSILNGEKIAPKTYIIDLGTIQPGHARKILLNIWTDEPMGFWFSLSVWYLPMT